MSFHNPGGHMQDTEENHNIGENVRLYRIRAGLTIKDLCKRINRHHQLGIKPGSIRNYEAGTEKIPAVALNCIATATNTEIHLFYEPASINILLDTSQKLHLLEAFSMIRCRSVRDSLLHLARQLGKPEGSTTES